MKSLLIIIALFFAFSAQAQVKVDSIQQKKNLDSLNLITSIWYQFIQFMHQRHIDINDYEVFMNIYNAFIEEKKKSWSK